MEDLDKYHPVSQNLFVFFACFGAAWPSSKLNGFVVFRSCGDWRGIAGRSNSWLMFARQCLERRRKNPTAPWWKFCGFNVGPFGQRVPVQCWSLGFGTGCLVSRRILDCTPFKYYKSLTVSKSTICHLAPGFWRKMVVLLIKGSTTGDQSSSKIFISGWKN